MSEKHTPGPWVYSAVSARIYFDDGDVRPTIALLDTDNVDGALTDADGRLIAAGPELLKACQDVRDWLIDPFTDGDAENENLHPAFRQVLRSVLPAIAKATGND